MDVPAVPVGAAGARGPAVDASAVVEQVAWLLMMLTPEQFGMVEEFDWNVMVPVGAGPLPSKCTVKVRLSPTFEV